MDAIFWSNLFNWYKRNWTHRLAWLNRLIDTSKLFDIINSTKVNQFAAYHNKNFLPLLWKSFKGNRAAVLNLMERHIQASTIKVESFNNFSDWFTFGGLANISQCAHFKNFE